MDSDTRDGLFRTDEPVDTAAANAEAARLAHELGVSSSSRPPKQGWGFSAMRGGGGGGGNHSTRASVASHTSHEYRRMETDNASLISFASSAATPQIHPSAAAELAARQVDALSSNNSSSDQLQQQQQQQPWVQHQEPMLFFDEHGQRAPYKEGPYFIAREKDGRVIKKRWCK